MDPVTLYKRINAVYESWAKKVSDAFSNLDQEWLHDLNSRSRLLVLLATVVALVFYIKVVEPPQEFPDSDMVSIPAGDSLSSASSVLVQEHVVRSKVWLELIVLVIGGEKGVFAGDYVFHEPKNIFQVARIITKGTFGLDPVRIRLPEGVTVRDMADIYAVALPRFDKQAFLEKALPLEGYLYPDTYFFLPNATADSVIDAMHQNFLQHIAPLQDQITAFGKSTEEIVTMASLLEKEARNQKDRQMIAGVLWNRLGKGMLLQVDASFRYINGKGTFDLTMADLAHASLYNTYKYPGLPPGPIGNPSIDSITAAITPVKSNYLFYLADKNGVTHYSVTYAEHLRKKRLYLGS